MIIEDIINISVGSDIYHSQVHCNTERSLSANLLSIIYLTGAAEKHRFSQRAFQAKVQYNHC